MGTTTRLALPYPELTDTPDVPRDIKALANKLDPIVTTAIPYVTTLPSNPANGDQIFLTAAGAPTWHLRYGSAFGDAWKWQFLGGSPFRINRDTDVSGFAASIWYASGCYLIVPVSGYYYVDFGVTFAASQMGTTSTYLCQADARRNGIVLPYGIATAGGLCHAVSTIAGNLVRRMSYQQLNAGDRIELHFFQDQGFAWRLTWLELIPLRVG